MTEDLSRADVSDWQRAAIAAIVGGHDSVADLPADLHPGVTDTAAADYLLIHLRRHMQSPTEEAALHALTVHEWLRALPKETDAHRTHPCPVCGRPAIGGQRYPLSVCDGCTVKATCPHGRIVMGFNTSVSGGFVAHHKDDQTPCQAVTEDGAVTVDGHPCHMGEARFGGTVVQALSATAE